MYHMEYARSCKTLTIFVKKLTSLLRIILIFDGPIWRAPLRTIVRGQTRFFTASVLKQSCRADVKMLSSPSDNCSSYICYKYMAIYFVTQLGITIHIETTNIYIK